MTDDPLREEHEALQHAVKASRRAFEATPDSAFVAAMKQAMDEYHAMREAGVSREDGIKGLDTVLRAHWGKPPSKFSAACSKCDDTGWQHGRCTHDHRCGRTGALIPNPHGEPFRTANCAEAHPAVEHDYVSPCDCPKGDRFRPRPTTFDDDMNALGRPKKKAKKGFTRF